MTVLDHGRSLALGLIAVAAVSVAPGRCDDLRVGGTGAALALMDSLGASFVAAHPADRVTVVAGLGTSGAIAAIAAGVLQVAVAGRELTAEEKTKGTTSAPFLRTPFVFVTSRASPPRLSLGEIVAVYAGDLRAWPDGAAIKPILRPRADAASLFLIERIPGMAEAMDALRTRPDVPVAATDQDNITAAQTIANSLAGATLLQVTTERPRLRIIELTGALPPGGAIETDAYELAQDLYLVTGQRPSPATERFLAFVRSPAGQSIIRDGGARPASSDQP